MPKGKGSSKSSANSHHRDFLALDPSLIYFTHARVRPFFTGCNKRIEQTLTEIVDGVTRVDQIPKITVMQINGNYFSLNNRRLYLFKELRTRGLLSTIEVQVKVPTDKEKLRYTPERCSLTARIMREHANNKGEGGVEGDDGDGEDEGVDEETDNV